MAISAEVQRTKITSATTTVILSAQASAADEARVKSGMVTLRNIGVADNVITLIEDVSATDYEVREFTLSGGQEWSNTGADAIDFVFTGTTDAMEITTSSTSEIHAIVRFIKKV